jgi:hypothetical protein
MKALLALFGISAIIAIAHTIWQKKQKRSAIPDKPQDDSSGGDNALPDSSDSEDSEEG